MDGARCEDHDIPPGAARIARLKEIQRTFGDELNWVITRRPSEQVVGTVGLRVQGHRVELGYVLARPYWGQGLATEAARAVVDWAIARPEVHRVWAVCDLDNHASARVLEKVGMERKGRLGESAVAEIRPDVRIRGGAEKCC